MRKSHVAIAALAVGLMIVNVGAARAYSKELVTIRVPFTFRAGETTLPAGNYAITRLDSDDPYALALRSVDGKVAVDLVTESGSSMTMAPQKTEVAFDVFGEQHFLSEVQVKGEPEGWTLQKTPAERQLERRGEKAKVVRLDVRGNAS
jgi:hypothetical protein